MGGRGTYSSYARATRGSTQGDPALNRNGMPKLAGGPESLEDAVLAARRSDYRDNCVSRVAVAVARSRGYDVEAVSAGQLDNSRLRQAPRSMFHWDDDGSAFAGWDKDIDAGTPRKFIKEQMLAWGDGSIAMLDIEVSSARGGRARDAHVMLVRNNGGTIEYIDPTPNSTVPISTQPARVGWPQLGKSGQTNSVELSRIDTATFTDAGATAMKPYNGSRTT